MSPDGSRGAAGPSFGARRQSAECAAQVLALPRACASRRRARPRTDRRAGRGRAAAHSGKSPGPAGSQSTPATVYSKLLAQLGFRRIFRLCFRRACEGWRKGSLYGRQIVRRAARLASLLLLQRTATGWSESREENNTSDAARTSRAADSGCGAPSASAVRAARAGTPRSGAKS